MSIATTAIRTSTASYFDQFVARRRCRAAQGWFGSLTGFFEYGLRPRRRGASARPRSPSRTSAASGRRSSCCSRSSSASRSIAATSDARAAPASSCSSSATSGRGSGCSRTRSRCSQRTDDPRFDNGWRPFELDQRHNLNVAGSVMLDAWRLGARVQSCRGNPYSPTRSAHDLAAPDPVGRHGCRLFFQLDVRADRRVASLLGRHQSLLRHPERRRTAATSRAASTAMTTRTRMAPTSTSPACRSSRSSASTSFHADRR